MQAERNIKVLTDREHIYQKTEMYAGGVSEVETTELVLDNGANWCQIKYVPALFKIINEVIDNSVDVHVKTPSANKPTVEITMTDSTVKVSDNGCGIPVRLSEDGIYLPRLCWGFARSGGNFDSKTNAGLGTFGVGSYITNVLSTQFKGTTCDGTHKYEVIFTDNAASFTENITKDTTRGTTVEFTPDLKRFNIPNIAKVYDDLVKQRLMNLKMAFPGITFKFNGAKIEVSNFKSYCQKFDLPFEMYETDSYSFAIMHNPNDDFQQFSYVNGLYIKDGGTHIDFITSNVVDRLRDKLLRKYKSIKPGDIKNKLFVVAFLRGFDNPKFNSQTKEKITNAPSEISKYFGDVPWDGIVQKIMRSAGIIDPITEVYKIREEMKRRQELKSLSKVRKVRCEKYLPPTRNQKYLMIVEGECLEENTPVLMATMDTMPIKDLIVGDVLLNRDHKFTSVKAITKLLKHCLKIKAGGVEVSCGNGHRFYVYNKETKKFCFKKAEDLVAGRDCLVKSRINATSRGAKVMNNDGSYIYLEDDTVSYTENDTFCIMRDGVITKCHGSFVTKNDVLIYSL